MPGEEEKNSRESPRRDLARVGRRQDDRPMIFGTRKKVGKGKEGGAPCSAVFFTGSSSLRYEAGAARPFYKFTPMRRIFFGRAFTLERASTPASLRPRVKLRPPNTPFVR